MTHLVIADHNGTSLNTATLHAIAAAQKVGGAISLAILGHDVAELAKEATSISGITKVLVADSPAYAHPLAENIAPLIVNLAPEFQAIWGAATATQKDLLPRIAALLDVQQISDITAVLPNNVFERPIYAGNAIVRIQSQETKNVISVRPTAFAPVAKNGGEASIENIATCHETGLSRFISAATSQSTRPDLANAKIVIAGGRGLQSSDNFVLVENLAEKLGAAIGASRAAVDAGYISNDYQVGQTGKVVAPDLYIAVGISGAIQHLAGMKDSKIIVAINKDQEAPIFQIADYGLVADLFDAIPELIAKL